MNSETNTVSVHVNDRLIQVPAGCTITKLISQLDLRGGPVAVEINRQLVPAADHSETYLSDGDQLEVVSLTGGG